MSTSEITGEQYGAFDAPKVEEHIVGAVTAQGDYVRTTATWTWRGAQRLWQELDDRRRAGEFPHVKFFVVRSVDDPQWNSASGPKWKDADRSVVAFIGVQPGQRGFRDDSETNRTYARSGAEKAARKAWKLWQGDKTPHNTTQGTGGWFYWRNGRTAAQGTRDLVRLALKHRMIVEGADKRWYVTELAKPDAS
jgi:hypothetical protein